MKKTLNLSLLIFFLLPWVAGAQVIKNGSFEQWNITGYDEPNGWDNSNRESFPRFGAFNVTKSTGQAGSAVKLQTLISGSDTSFAFVSNTMGDPLEGEGGVPYSQQPTSITGHYKYDIKSGDSALMLILFKKAGVVVSMDMYKISGTQSSWTSFSFPITLAVVPDSVIIAAASSNAIDNVGVKNGSTLELDNLAFAGTGITQAIPNGNFESWTAKSIDQLIDWASQPGPQAGVTRSTDKYKGDYAVLLTSQADQNNSESFPGVITNGMFPPNDGPRGGVPYTANGDTLEFYYKYIPSGTDTAVVGLMLNKNGNGVGGAQVNLMPASTYTKMQVPFSAFTAPDTLLIIFASSNWPSEPTNAGSKLYIDEVQLKSQPLNTGIKNTLLASAAVTSYPNPAADVLNLQLEAVRNGALSLEIFDLKGAQVLQKDFTVLRGSNTLSIDIQNIACGSYLYRMVSAGGEILYRSSFVKQ